MKVLVTGAGGFLGRSVVSRLLGKGHSVKAVLRPASEIPPWGRDVEVFRSDLRDAKGLTAAFEDVGAVIHLAVGTLGDDDAILADTLLGTERLLAAMEQSPVRRIVLASSFVVYDWRKARGTLDEESHLDTNIYERSGYDIAKHWQERMFFRAATRRGWEVVILRPGFVWGRGRAAIAGMGRIIGPFHVLIGPWTRLPLTHVENCADCFVVAVESSAAAGQVFNVIDSDFVRVWRYAREYARGTEWAGVPVPVPYRIGLGLAHLAAISGRLLFGKKSRLPSILTPQRFVAQFKPLRFSNRRLRNVLGWNPPLSFEECLSQTYGSELGNGKI